MSLKSWYAEFMPIPASRAKKWSWEKALMHSIQKWEGLTPEALRKHRIDRSEVAVNCDTCALCVRGRVIDPKNICRCCPIFLSSGKACDQHDEKATNPEDRRSPYMKFVLAGDAEPMCRLLQNTLQWLMQTKEKDSKMKNLRHACADGTVMTVRPDIHGVVVIVSRDDTKLGTVIVDSCESNAQVLVYENDEDACLTRTELRPNCNES